MFLALSLGVTSIAGAADFDEALKAYKRGNYATALQGFQSLAEEGHDSAQFNLGLMYANGEGVPQDGTAAVRWYRKAAEQGDTDALFNVGLMYNNGHGVSRTMPSQLNGTGKRQSRGMPVPN